MSIDSVALTQKLVQFRSLNPPGEEKACIEFLANMLSDAPIQVETFEFEPDCPSLIAKISGSGSEKPLCFTGHVDVVPLGAKQWKMDPFAGDIRDGKLFGRGSSDMKAGVAAFVAATLAQVQNGKRFRRGITLVITAGEETGCQGAFHLSQLGVLGPSALLIVAEPSSNSPIIAHKGSLRLSVSAPGRSSHSSMPELGDNAINKVVEWVQRLNAFEFESFVHPLLGKTTASVTTIFGGQNINSVPDFAGFTIDFRTIPNHLHSDLLRDVQMLLGSEAKIEVVTNFRGFSTSHIPLRCSPFWRFSRSEPADIQHLLAHHISPMHQRSFLDLTTRPPSSSARARPSNVTKLTNSASSVVSRRLSTSITISLSKCANSCSAVEPIARSLAAAMAADHGLPSRSSIAWSQNDRIPTK